jgi:ABC-type Fe3+/spermidine/putrescine transport system ATPase subunit
LPIGAAVRAMIRPESITLSPPQPDQATNSLTGAIEMCEYLGQSIRYFVQAAATALTVREPRSDARRRAAPGERVTLYWSPQATSLFPK